jgi:hypothetical protein
VGFPVSDGKDFAHMNRILGLLTGVALTVAALPAAAEPATLLGVFGNWTAFTTGSGASLTCFASSKPRASRPAAKRGNIYLLVSDWPSRKVRGEPQIVYGYQAKEAGAAALGIGPDKFNFFIRNSGKDGNGWLLSLNDSQKLVDAMRGGVSAVASGTTPKGVKTIDTYSLQGFGDALDKVHATCQM